MMQMFATPRAPVPDCTTWVISSLQAVMLHITSAQVTSGHCLVFQFDDGTHGEVDLSAELTGPIFEELLDPEHFKQAYVDPELRTVCWPNAADFAPEFLKRLVLAKQLV